jgi:hypothetical protein
MTTTAKAPPAVQWVVRPGSRPHLCGACKLGGRWYFVEPVFADEWAERPVLAGYRLTCLETGSESDVDLRWMECSCGDFLWRKSKRGGVCKHLRAIQELLP